MAITCITPSAEPILQTNPPLVYWKQRWNDEWQLAPQLEPTHLVSAVACADMDRCELRRRYGRIKQWWKNDFDDYTPVGGTDNSWVAVVAVSDDGGQQTIFMGQISGEGREVYDPTAQGASGVQNFVAFGPLQILRKLHLSHSVWAVGGVETVCHWLPDINDSKRGRAVERGNRSTAKIVGTYLYDWHQGADNRSWSHYDYLEYLLAWFATQPGGPAWTIDGPGVAALQNITETVQLGESATLDQIIRRLVPLRYGLDWYTRPTAGGFSVHVFPLSATVHSFGGWTIPANPDRVQIALRGSQERQQCRVAFTADHLYKKVRTIGRRIVVCCTLASWNSTLVPGWGPADETAYKAGLGGGTTAKQHDLARASHRYRDVFQRFVAPADWDHQDNAANPYCFPGPTIQAVAQYQNAQRHTLAWTPMKVGWDYSQDPPVATGDSPGAPELMPPAAWIGQPGLDPAHPSMIIYTACEKCGMHVSALHNDLGIFLECQPNHLLAKNHWSGAASTAKSPKYDWSNLEATVAFETDMRFEVVYENPDPAAEGEMVLEVKDAQLWYLAADTVVGTDTEGGLVKSTSAQVLRMDLDLLELVMAGYLSRYADSRCRAEITVPGIRPWSDLRGQILASIGDPLTDAQLAAPITQIVYQFEPHPQTSLHAGFAGGANQH